MNTGLDQYMDIFKDAVDDSAAKISIYLHMAKSRFTSLNADF